MQPDSIYWFFSSSAQAIAALVAFLIAGMALVQAMMDNAQLRDDSLADIHSSLQSLHYRLFRLLIIWACLAVGFSLTMLVYDVTSSPLKICVAYIVGTSDWLVIACVIWFVIIILDPRKYQVNAQLLFKQERKRQNLPEPLATDKEFFTEFVKLESSIKNLLKKKRLYIPDQYTPGQSLSFRQMIDALQHHELILQPFYDELQQINYYRNLVFHGKIHETDQNMIDRIILATNQILELIPKRNSSKRTTSRRTPAPVDASPAAPRH